MDQHIHEMEYVHADVRNKRVFTGLQPVILIFLFLMALNFQNRFYYLTFGAMALLFVVQTMRLSVHQIVFAPILLATALCIFSNQAHTALTTIKMFSYPICVLLGYNLVSSSTLETRERQLRIILICLAWGSFSHYVLNMIHNWNSDTRNTVDFWTQTILSATGQAALACPMIGVASAVVFTTKKNWIKTLYIAVLAVIVYYNLVLAGRTIFVLMAVGLLIGFFSNFRSMKRATKKLKFVIGVAVVVVVMSWTIRANAFNIQAVFAESNFFSRFLENNVEGSILEDSRMEYKLEFLKRMMDHPWGGQHILNEIGHYAHDVFLDTYDEAGVFALLAVILILADVLKKMVKICKSGQVSYETKSLLLCFVCVVFLEFIVEPILEGVPWLFACLCIFYGAQERIYALSCQNRGGA